MDPALPQTFQVRLYVDGSIQFAYSAVNPTSAVVGIAPGSAQPGTTLVSFLNDASAEYPAAVVERFGNTVDIDIVSLAQKFYQTHDDAYDYLVIYNNMSIDAMAGALAYEATVRSSGTGYSVAQQDYGLQYGSAARLRSVMNMGRLDYYPVDVTKTVPLRAAAQDTPLTALGHESGHLFLAYASIPDPAGSTAKPMLGYQAAHWSFVYDSEASLDEGEQITDLGSGHFVTAAVTQGFAPLDRYLMGFAPASDVADTFVALNPSVSPLGHPQSGYGFTGTRFNISVNDVMQAVGRRTPDYTVAQHRFRFGFVMVVPAGTPDSSLTDNVQQVETYRQQFVAAYTKFSANLGAADTTLNHSVRLSLFPAAGRGGRRQCQRHDFPANGARGGPGGAVGGARRLCAGARAGDRCGRRHQRDFYRRGGKQGGRGGTAGDSRRCKLRSCLRARAGGGGVATHAAGGASRTPFQGSWRRG